MKFPNNIKNQIDKEGFAIIENVFTTQEINLIITAISKADDKKISVEGFGPWTIKQNQFAVQPPLDILKNNYTIRIHLDDTDENNGALKIIPKSHLKGVYRPETINWENEREVVCKIQRGGIMIMH